MTDWRVYVITTTVPRFGRDHFAIAQAAVAGGANALQFRDKAMNDSDFTATATRLLALTRGKIPLIVNDRVEIAAAIGAEGVHVGQSDATVKEVSQKLGRGRVIGISATCYEEAIRACESGADYIGVGPIFPTGSKADCTPAIGLRELELICHNVKLPVIAIGGINVANVKSIVDAGAAGAAVIAAVAEAEDMVEAVVKLREAWRR